VLARLSRGFREALLTNPKTLNRAPIETFEAMDLALGAACAQATVSARLLLAGLHELAGNALATARTAVSPPPCAAVEPGSLAVVTGASRGIGEVVAAELYAYGAHVVLACRSAERGEAVAARIRAQALCARCSRAAGDVCVRVLDLASTCAVAAHAADFQAEHGARQRTVVFNACAPMAPPARSESADALELQFATNFLAHLLVAQELAPEGAAGSSLVRMTSMTRAASRMAVGDVLAVRRQNYVDSKLALVLAAAELNRRLAGGGGASVACNPGLVDTGLARTFFLGWMPASLLPALRAPLNARRAACCSSRRPPRRRPCSSRRPRRPTLWAASTCGAAPWRAPRRGAPTRRWRRGCARTAAAGGGAERSRQRSAA
jgi:NAD(P)-dependent dehydrogenase (short-subunit alcohol dehydrogenase family)